MRSILDSHASILLGITYFNSSIHRYMKLRAQGFTLIEMLIVIVIIGILARALIPTLQGMQGSARDAARTADLNQV